PVLLSASGRSPAVSFGDGNIVHTVWVEESGLNYAQIDPGQPHIFEPVLAVRLPVEEAADRGGNQLSGPEIASSEDWVYIFWAVLSLSDEEAGSSFANYVSFPVGAAQNGSPTRLLTFNDRGIPTADYKGDLNLEQIIPPPIYLEAMEKYGELYDFDMQFGSSTVTQTDIIGAVSDYILNLSAASQQRQTVAVSFAMVREDRLNKTMDIGVALFSKGLYQGYQNVSNTSEFSDQARLLIDAENNIHAVWREGAKGKSIYFASTAPQAKSYLDQFVPSDVFTIFAPMLLDSVVGISFLPGLLLWWAVPGFLIVGSTAYFYEGAKEKKKFTVGIILLAVLIYHMIKVTMLPSIFTYVPFSAWLFIPTGWRLPLRVATPLVIAGLGLLIAGRTFKQGKGIILPYVYAVLTDAVLVLMVYGVNFLGAF
ncbi:MAG: hypothetical protein OEY93_10820, partial [Anaerolineae bacterium]|nr:hypothetical protein [Anaerolineae bacterium]